MVVLKVLDSSKHTRRLQCIGRVSWDVVVSKNRRAVPFQIFRVECGRPNRSVESDSLGSGKYATVGGSVDIGICLGA